MSRNRKDFRFILKDVNIERIHYNYGFDALIPASTNVPNTTPIEKIDEIPKTMSFFDHNKNRQDCEISIPKLNPSEKIRCFWDHHEIPNGVRPIGCPIRYVPSSIVKTYVSELSKDQYMIVEYVSRCKSNVMNGNKDPRYTLHTADYYESDGVFCSFNCCLAFIRKNKHIPMYANSETLLIEIYRRTGHKSEIIPAANYTTLTSYGGAKSIEKFRDSSACIEHHYQGFIRFAPIGHVYSRNMLLQ